MAVQRQAQTMAGPGQPVLADRPLPEILRRTIPVCDVEKVRHLHDRSGGNMVGGGLAILTAIQTLYAAGCEAFPGRRTVQTDIPKLFAA